MERVPRPVRDPVFLADFVAHLATIPRLTFEADDRSYRSTIRIDNGRRSDECVLYMVPADPPFAVCRGKWSEAARVPLDCWARVNGIYRRSGPVIDAKRFLMKHPQHSAAFIGEFMGVDGCLCCHRAPTSGTRRFAGERQPHERPCDRVDRSDLCDWCFVAICRARGSSSYLVWCGVAHRDGQVARRVEQVAHRDEPGLPLDVCRLVGAQWAAALVIGLRADCQKKGGV